LYFLFRVVQGKGMKTVLALQVATLLALSIPGMAATVEYQHPDLTIVAREEPLDEVLKALGKELRIYITVPTGLNPLVSCDVQRQPIKQAFKMLLGDMSYSLEWEQKTGQLVGLTILAGGGESAVSSESSHDRNMSQPAPAPIAATGGQATVPKPVGHGDHDAAMADHDANMEAARAEHEARMETDRAEHEARMAEERAAQEERMKEEVARQEAEMRAYIESQGLPFPD
jgi:hypothetical protein